MEEKELYKKELEKLYKESEGKNNEWSGWLRIEILEDILIKYKYNKIS